MPTTAGITYTDLREHPAVRAWRELRPRWAEPERIEILQEVKKSAVYRLEGVGLGGTAIIAKRCRMGIASTERIIYESVLPVLPITALHYYGFVEEDDQFCWLFLEDAGRERFSPLIEEHRALAARWLALMHISAERVSSAAQLPNEGPDRYLEHLHSGRDMIRRHLSHPALSADDLAVLEAVICQCDFLESRWDKIEKECEGIPTTLVHGDFQPKNMHVRTGPVGMSLFPVDWEMAGWGVPAADLAPAAGLALAPQVDIITYWTIVHACWPGLNIQAIQRLVNVGQVFRQLAAIHWASLSLACDYIERPMARLRSYQAALAEIIRSTQ